MKVVCVPNNPIDRDATVEKTSNPPLGNFRPKNYIESHLIRREKTKKKSIYTNKRVKLPYCMKIRIPT